MSEKDILSRRGRHLSEDVRILSRHGRILNGCGRMLRAQMDFFNEPKGGQTRNGVFQRRKEANSAGNVIPSLQKNGNAPGVRGKSNGKRTRSAA